MAEKDIDQSELPTSHKLEQARERGQVAKSSEVVGLVMVAAAALAIFALSQRMGHGLVGLTLRLLTLDPQQAWTPDSAATWLGQALRGGLEILAPLFFMLAVMAVLANLGQTGPMFSPEALKPNFSKLNPATGMKRFFSLRFVFDAVKSCVKMAVLLAVSYSVVKGMVGGLLSLTELDSKGYPGVMVSLAGSLYAKLIFALLIVAIVDFIFTRWEFTRQMRMSKREVRDEHKQREGDPRIRQRMRQLRQELMKRARALKSVPGADVVITNPTHLAVALRYAEEDGKAPQLLAKGAGEMAQKMKAVARRHGVSIVENKPLARALFREVEVDGFVPQKWYPDVARILVWIYVRRQQRSAFSRNNA